MIGSAYTKLQCGALDCHVACSAVREERALRMRRTPCAAVRDEGALRMRRTPCGYCGCVPSAKRQTVQTNEFVRIW